MAPKKVAHFTHSTLRERTVEHLFVGELLRALWQRGVFDVEVLRSEFDAHGYDVVLSRGDVTRHVQLKTGTGKMPPSVQLGLSLATKPSGCAIWIQVSPDLELKPYFFFGGSPGKPLPSIRRFATPLRPTHNKQGIRPQRTNHRLVPRARFTRLEEIDDVVDALFDSVPRRTIAQTVRALVGQGKSNADIWAELQRRFGLGEDKKWYPAWYRASMKRKSKLERYAGVGTNLPADLLTNPRHFRDYGR